jgi:hypothetical protein
VSAKGRGRLLVNDRRSAAEANETNVTIEPLVLNYFDLKNP